MHAAAPSASVAAYEMSAIYRSGANPHENLFAFRLPNRHLALQLGAQLRIEGFEKSPFGRLRPDPSRFLRQIVAWTVASASGEDSRSIRSSACNSFSP